MNKNKLGIIFIIFILVISAFTIVTGREDANEKDDYIIKRELSETDREVLDESYKMATDKDFSNIKAINYNIAMFFYNLSNKNYDEININPEFLEFLGVSPSEYLTSKYRIDSVSLYEIAGVENMSEYNKTLIKIKHKYEDKDNFSFKTFSLDNNMILDEPYLYLKDIKDSVVYEDIIFYIDSKVVFKDKTIYKINIKNNGNEIFYMDYDMYGFHAIQGMNKYHHKIYNGDFTSYRVHPRFENTLYIVFENLRGNASVYIKINGNNVLLIKE